jgi:acyl dehydratase
MATLTIQDLEHHSGQDLGTSNWHVVTQERVDLFADATGDHQWIHIDRERAAAGPFGGTVAHGYLTLSLIPQLLAEVVQVTGPDLAVNYGLNRVRFPAPLPTGSRVRASVECQAVQEVAGGHQAVFRISVDRESSDKPVCIADQIVFYALPANEKVGSQP